MATIGLHHQHQLLVLLVLFVTSLPSTCSKTAEFLPVPNFPAFRDARRSANSEQPPGGSGEPGRWKELDTKDLTANKIAKYVAKQENLIPSHIVQAFYNGQHYDRKYWVLFNAWTKRCISHVSITGQARGPTLL